MDVMTSSILREANNSLMDGPSLPSLKTEGHLSLEHGRHQMSTPSDRTYQVHQYPHTDHRIPYDNTRSADDYVLYETANQKEEILNFTHSSTKSGILAAQRAQRPHSSPPETGQSVPPRTVGENNPGRPLESYPSLYRSIADLIRSESAILSPAGGLVDMAEDEDEGLAKFSLPCFGSPSSAANTKNSRAVSSDDPTPQPGHFSGHTDLFGGHFPGDRHNGKPTVFDMFDSQDYLGQGHSSDLPFDTGNHVEDAYQQQVNDAYQQQVKDEYQQQGEEQRGLTRVSTYPMLKTDIGLQDVRSMDSLDMMMSDTASKYDDSDYSNASTDRYSSRYASPSPHHLQQPHSNHFDGLHFNHRQSSPTPAPVGTPVPSPSSSSQATCDDAQMSSAEDRSSDQYLSADNESKGDRVKGKGGCKPRGAQNLPPCRVCGNTASGLHFGVNTCEACNEFFRRSLKRGATYYCSKNRECQVYGKKRNACSFCRYQRCVEMGMSRDAIKTGRYSHKTRTEYAIEVEKTKIKEVNRAEKEKFEALLIDLVKCHDKYLKVSTRVPQEELLRNQSSYLELYLTQREHEMRHPPLQTPVENKRLLEGWETAKEDLSLTMHDAEMTEKWLRNYINYAKNVPGFKELALSDQASLVRGSWFEFWFLGAFRGYNSKLQVVAYPNGRCFHKEEIRKVFGDEYTDFSFDLADRMRSLDVSPDVLVLIKTVCLTFPDRTTLDNKEAVSRMHWMMVSCLLHTLERLKPGDNFIFPLVVSKLVELR